MVCTSDRATRTQLSPIRKLKPLADQARRAGKTIHHLNLGQPDIPTPEAFLVGVRNTPEIVAYSPSQGLDEAVQALTRYYEDQGISVSSQEIIITAGGSEALWFALLATTDPGDRVLVPEPFYANYNSFATMAGVEIVPIVTRAENGFRLPDRTEIEKRIPPRAKAILMCHPGNPTGTVYTDEELATMRDVALQHDLFVICDEVYREFVYDGLTHRSVLQLEGLEDRAILVDSISKRFSACGARIGAIASRSPDVMEAAFKFAQARLSPPTLGQLGLIRLLESSGYRDGIRAMIVEFERRRDLVHREVQGIPGALSGKPQGAFYLIVKLPVDSAERLASWLLTDFDVDGETVMVAPAQAFYRTPGLGADEVRIAYVLEAEKLKRAMRVLREGIAAYPGTRVQAAT